MDEACENVTKKDDTESRSALHTAGEWADRAKRFDPEAITLSVTALDLIIDVSAKRPYTVSRIMKTT